MAISFDLTGRGALVTGANTGIGQAIAVALAEAGADVAVAGRSEPAETLQLIEATGRKAINIRRWQDSGGSTFSLTMRASSAAPICWNSVKRIGMR